MQWVIRPPMTWLQHHCHDDNIVNPFSIILETYLNLQSNICLHPFKQLHLNDERASFYDSGLYAVLCMTKDLRLQNFASWDIWKASHKFINFSNNLSGHTARRLTLQVRNKTSSAMESSYEWQLMMHALRPCNANIYGDLMPVNVSWDRLFAGMSRSPSGLASLRRDHCKSVKVCNFMSPINALA